MKTLSILALLLLTSCSGASYKNNNGSVTHRQYCSSLSFNDSRCQELAKETCYGNGINVTSNETYYNNLGASREEQDTKKANARILNFTCKN